MEEEIIQQPQIEEQIPAQQERGYQPRPKYQIVAAWVGFTIVFVGFLLYCWQIAFGA